MKILHINSYYNVSSFYKNLYDCQISNKMDIDVYVPVSLARRKNSFDLGKYTKISVNHTKYDRICFHLKHTKIYNDIIKQYNIYEYSIIHAHSLFSNGYIAYKLNKKYNTPYLVAVRNTDVNLFFSKMFHLRKMGVEILKNAQKVIFLSKNYEERVIERYIPKKYRQEIKNKSIVIPNGINEFWLENQNINIKESNKQEIKLIYVGRVDKNKNIETTIKACQQLISKGYNVTYNIVGEVKEKKYIKLIKKYSFIKYVSKCEKESLIKYYRDADIFVMPSKHETFGLVYAEAMSQGLPIIYTKGEGFDGQFAQGEVGYSVKYDDIHELVDKIIKIINNYSYITQNCIREADRFSWNKIEKQYNEIYADIIRR